MRKNASACCKSHRLGDLVEVHVAGHDLVVRADDADERTGHFLLRKPQGVVQRAMGGVLKSVNDGILDHMRSFLGRHGVRTLLEM